MNRPLFVAAYDISHPKRLRKCHKVLKSISTGGQLSVFECFLSGSEVASTLNTVGEVIDRNEDAFLLIRLDPRSAVYTLGRAIPPKDPPFFLVD